MTKDEQNETIDFLEKKCGKLSVEYNLFVGLCDMINFYAKNSNVFKGTAVINGKTYLNITYQFMAEILSSNEHTVKHAIRKCEKQGIVEVRTEKGYRSKLIRPLSRNEMLAVEGE